MKVIIDRFEGDIAVLEMPDMQFVNAPAKLFEGAKEGDVISITIDTDETQTREKNIEKLMKQVWSD